MKTHVEEYSPTSFEGWLLDDQGNEIPDTRVQAGNKIAIGSKLGKIKKQLTDTPVKRTEVSGDQLVDDQSTDDEEYTGQPEKKPKPKKDENVSFYYATANATELKEDRKKFVEAMVKRAKETRDINGVTCHIVEGNWSSNFKFTHGAIHYSFEVLKHGDEFEVVISDGYLASLGVSYFDQHAPKFCDWFKTITDLTPTGDTIHGSRKKYPNHMLIWLGNSYKILATKPI